MELHDVSYGIKYVARPLLLFFSSENRLLWFRYREYDLAHLKLVFEFSIYNVWKSVQYGVSNGLDTAYWGFLGARIRRIFLDGYGVLVFRILQEDKLAQPELPKFEDHVVAELTVEEKKEDVQKKLDKLEKRTQKTLYQPMVIRTSWTQANPGRRFRCCSRSGNPCGYFFWVDPAMCARSTAIIPGLLRNINNLQAEAMENARKARRMKMLLCFTDLFGALDLCDALGVAAEACDGFYVLSASIPCGLLAAEA
ncbi:hypothetical protein Tco_0044972 [Tanacetum coccineum]